MAGWLLTFAVMTIGGWFAWLVLGAGLCEDDDSPGSDTYCNQGGWEASGLAFASLAVLAYSFRPQVSRRGTGGCSGSACSHRSRSVSWSSCCRQSSARTSLLPESTSRWQGQSRLGECAGMSPDGAAAY